MKLCRRAQVFRGLQSLPVRGAWVEMLKFAGGYTVPSLPVRGAWVEIDLCQKVIVRRVSLPVRGAWVEIVLYLPLTLIIMSLPVRGAWVEIRLRSIAARKLAVAPRAGSVG